MPPLHQGIPLVLRWMRCCSTLTVHESPQRNWCICFPSGHPRCTNQQQTGTQGPSSLRERHSWLLLQPEGVFLTGLRLCTLAAVTSSAASRRGKNLRIGHKPSSGPRALLPQAQGSFSGNHLEYWHQCTTDMMKDTSRKNNMFAQFRKNERDKQKLIDTVVKQLRSLINTHHS
ncbi:UNVERIFIED_CONTAM: hypothetical protein FKN15_038949 [Acipenser sinensis]